MDIATPQSTVNAAKTEVGGIDTNRSIGFDVKIMRAVLKLRKMDAADRDEQEYLLEAYRKALDV